MPDLPDLPDQASEIALVHARRVCADPAPDQVSCHAQVRTKGDGATPDATVKYSSGLRASQLTAAYQLAATGRTTKVAVVDAYASPNAAADLAAYRAEMGLPPLLAGQFQQFNQSGGAITTVGANVGWGQEEMLDLEMVSAICPSCNIVYVGANSAYFTDLAAAVRQAVTQGATVVSNSYGGGELSSTSISSAYDAPGVAFTVSSGDNGYGVESPASFNTVVAVGGTSLKVDATTGARVSETAWSGAGSGCSAYAAKKIWQNQVTTNCARRAVADVSAVADPNTGVAVYSSYGSSGGANWMVFGGTSVAAPIVAGIYGLTGATSGYPAARLYDPASAASLFDVTSGSNGRCVRGKSTSGANLCTAVKGWDGPTGVGTPKGLGAFS